MKGLGLIAVCLLLFCLVFFVVYGIAIIITKIKNKNNPIEIPEKEPKKFFYKRSIISLIITSILTISFCIFIKVDHNLALQKAKTKGDNDPFSSNNGEWTPTTFYVDNITVPEVITTSKEFDSATDEIEAKANKILYYKELTGRNWTVRIDPESPTLFYFFVDFTANMTVEETISLAEQDVDLIKSDDSVGSFSVYWRGKDGSDLGNFSSLYNSFTDLRNDMPLMWFKDEYKEAYKLMHQNEETTADPKQPTENVLYDNDGIKIVYKTFSSGASVSDPLHPSDPKVKLYIENNSDSDISVYLHNESVNEYMISMRFYEEVAAGKKSNCDITISRNQLDENGIRVRDISTIAFCFRIYNESTKEYFTTDPITIKL